MQSTIFLSADGYVSKLKKLWDEPLEKWGEPLDLWLTFSAPGYVTGW